MAFTVIKDVEHDVAALIDAEYGRALGPIATGEKAVEMLEKFAGAHGVDPATIPTPELEIRWKEFVTGITRAVSDTEGIVHAVADVVSGDGHAAAGADPTPPAGTAAAQSEPSPTGALPAGSSAGADGEPKEQAPPPADAADATPVVTPEIGNVICPTCDGWRETVKDGVASPCPTCGGKGQIPAHREGVQGAPAA